MSTESVTADVAELVALEHRIFTTAAESGRNPTVLVEGLVERAATRATAEIHNVSMASVWLIACGLPWWDPIAETLAGKWSEQ